MSPAAILVLLCASQLAVVANGATAGASGTEKIHVAMFSDRSAEATAPLNSICSNTEDASLLVFHVVVSDETVTFDTKTASACSQASVLVYTLEALTSEIRELGMLVTWELEEVRQTPLTVHVANWDYSPKHKTGFNHLRFYMPYLSPFRELDAVIFIDDDIVLRGDVARLWELDLGGAVVGAGCLNWVWNKCERMESSLTLSYAEVPYFGFGVLGPERSVENATCKSSEDSECMPEGFLQSIEDESRRINGPDGVLDLEALNRDIAWNFGLNKFDLGAWRATNATERYIEWMKANLEHGWFPETSLAYGLGIAFLAWSQDLACVDHALPILHGLGFVQHDDLVADLGLESLEIAYALHWNGGEPPPCVYSW